MQSIIAGKTRVMRNDGQYDTVDAVTAETPATKTAPATAVVTLVEAKRTATVTLNENDVWQEPWAE